MVAIFDPDTEIEPLYDPSDLDAAPIPAEGNIGPTRWTDINKPVIAAVNGAAYAGGLEWACLAHIRIADQHASFGVTCRRWNVGLGDGGTQRLPRMIGLSRALDLIITGRVIGAAEAERIGLVNEVTESGRCLDRALDLAADISALPSRRSAPTSKRPCVDSVVRWKRASRSNGNVSTRLLGPARAQDRFEAVRRA